MTIKEMPVYADAWMRRGQARAAMGKDEDSLQDFEQCLKLTSESARKVCQRPLHECVGCVWRTALSTLHPRPQRMHAATNIVRVKLQACHAVTLAAEQLCSSHGQAGILCRWRR